MKYLDLQMKDAIKMQAIIIYFVCVPSSYGVCNNVTHNFGCTSLNLLAQVVNEILTDMTLKQHYVLEHKQKLFFFTYLPTGKLKCLVTFICHH